MYIIRYIKNKSKICCTYIILQIWCLYSFIAMYNIDLAKVYEIKILEFKVTIVTDC